MRNEPAVRSNDLADHPLRPVGVAPRTQMRTRTIVVRQGAGWQPFALLGLCLLLLAVVLLGHRWLGALERQNQDTLLVLSGVERKIQQLDSGIGFDSRRRQLLLGMRDHIMRVNPRVSLGDAYRYAELALDAGDR